MKKGLRLFLMVFLFVMLAASCFALIQYFYQTSSFFRGLFEGANGNGNSGNVGAGAGYTTGSNTQEWNVFYSKLSFYIFASIMVMQCTALFLAATVFVGIRRSLDTIDLKLKKMENADIFLDLPLYIGLFGTVSSFIVMSFNPQISRLIAYASTLIGIIFSVILRLSLQFPIRQKLLDIASNLKKTQTGEKLP
jgi:hypothetical protein